MKALELQSVGNLVLVEAPVPAVAADELLIRTEASLFCTSDLIDIRENPFGIRLPVILGHEASGRVAEVGAEVTGFRCGERVATHPVHPCFQCAACLDGLPHLCERMGHFGIDRPGTFAEFYTVRQDRARRVPPGLDPAVAALAEPVAVCLEALEQARVQGGDGLLVLGDGPFGALLARLAVRRGDLRVVIAGHDEWRLAFAAGAHQIVIREAPDAEATLRRAGAGGYDAVIVAVSSADAYALALPLLRPRGRCVAFSPVAGATPIDMTLVHMKELELVGAVNDRDRFDAAIDILSAADGALGELVTHRFPVEQYREALATAQGHRGERMKVAVTWRASGWHDEKGEACE